ncbi:phosphopantetheine-binding protein [Saccharothrix sp. Mg75]|uniref:phosphopantetheine-binding protein n=1 Tax=Saccharothrix sp. Mg75 TaxID=3445357 RepID=UPI003EEB0452
MVRSVWRDCLDTDVTDGDDFFDLGGDSATALAICARIEAELGVRPELRALFDHPGFADFAHRVDLLAREATR